MRARAHVAQHPTDLQRSTRENHSPQRPVGTSRPVLEALAPISDLIDRTPAIFQTRLIQRVATLIRTGTHPKTIAIHLDGERPDPEARIDIVAWINSRLNTLPRS